MHPTALELGRRFFETYGSKTEDQRILDVGSMDVNGSLRSVASPSDEYVGIDVAAGEGVDVVVEPSAEWPFPDDRFDLVVSTSCMEHDMLFWQTFEKMLDVLKPGGFLYLNVPANGKYHAHPFDCWRFYPDSGIALELWAQKLGVPCQLMESFTYDQAPTSEPGSEWNDQVLVFQKGNRHRIYLDRAMSDGDPKARNVRRFGDPELRRPSEPTEDQTRRRHAEQTVTHLLEGRRDDDALHLAEGRPFLSIVVAYYQGCTSNEAFERFLASLDAQTYRDFEVLLFHDGPLLEPVLCPYAVTATPTRTAQWGHDLRAHGLLSARGVYVLHTNADNEYSPGAFEGIADVLRRQPVDVAVGEVDMMGLIHDPVAGTIDYDRPRDYSKSVRFTGESVAFQSVDLMQAVIRRSVWRQYGFIGRDAGADGRLIERIATERGYVRLPFLIGRHF